TCTSQNGSVLGMAEIQFAWMRDPQRVGEQALEAPVVTALYKLTGRHMAPPGDIHSGLNAHVGSPIWSECVRLDDFGEEPGGWSFCGFVELSEFAPSQVLGIIRLKIVEYR